MRTSHTQGERRETIPQAEIKNHGFFATALGGLLLFVAMAAPALAEDAVWGSGNPTPPPIDGNWNSGGNWVGGIAPVNAGDTATFNTSTITSLELSGTVTIDSMTFNSGASAFTIDTIGNSFSFVGVGIVNNSNQTQTIRNVVGGSTNFLNSSTAGNVTLINDFSGFTSFLNSSSAGTATIMNINGGSGGGVTNFRNTSTAANANITNSGQGTATNFFDTSMAGNATIQNVVGGITNFKNSSTAGSATITMSGDGTVSGSGFTNFSDTSSAGNATIDNNAPAIPAPTPGLFIPTLVFANFATANAAVITNSGPGSFTSFADTSTAGNAMITNSGTGSGTSFFDSATAEASLITNAGQNSAVEFFNTSTAGNATITNSGTGSFTRFFDSATAGASLITNTGDNAATFFVDSSSAGNARLINANPTAFFDISGLTTGGTTAGSIEGNGTFFLGSNNLTVGSDGLSTPFSGVIQDGGVFGGTGGSLTKAGTGVLTLTGVNTYTGATTVDAGALLVDGSLAAASAVTVNSGATLGGTGTSAGAVTIADGGILAPGNSPGTPGTFTVGSLSLSNASLLNYDLGTPGVIVSGVNDRTIVTGNLVLDGSLNTTALGGFGPGAYRLFNYGGALTDNTLDIGTVPTGFSASNFIVVTGVPNEVDLLVLKGPLPPSVQFWDGPNMVPGVTEGGSGNWDNFMPNWTDQNGNNNSSWQNGMAVFGGLTSGIVTVTQPIFFTGMEFMTDGYQIDQGVEASLNLIGSPFITTDTGVTATINATLNGAGGITKEGPGTLILTAANTYLGITTINAGVLSISSDANLGTAPGAPVANQLTFNGGTLQATASFDLATNRGITLLGGGGTIEVTGANTLSYAGSISGTSNLGNLTKVGTGTLILGGRNSYTGTTFVNDGTLTLVNSGVPNQVIPIGPLIIGDDVGAPNTATVIDTGGDPVPRIGRSVPVTVNSDGLFEVDFGDPVQGIGQGVGQLVINRGNVRVEGSLLPGFQDPVGQHLEMNGGLIFGGGTIVLPDVTATSDASGNAARISANAKLPDVSRVLTVNDGPGSTDLLISGVIFQDTVPVGITKEGTGTLVLTGANTYTGLTIVTAGTLAEGVSNAISTGDLTINGATAIFDLGANHSDSVGIVTLDGGGSITGTGTSTLTSTGSFEMKSGTVSAILGGSVALNKTTTGTVTLSGANTYTGATTVNAGSLIVDGSIASEQTFVNAGGLLGGGPAIAEAGRGIIGGDLTNSGIVSPGNSPGTLTVAGNYTQTTGGTLRIEVAGTAQGQFDLLAVGGHASLAGTLQLRSLRNFQLQVGDNLTFLTARGGVSGTFSTVLNPFISNTLVKAEIIFLPNAVQLEGTQGSFTAVACNSNTLAVAEALDSAVGDPSASGLIEFLDTQPLSELCGDLELIAPDELPAMFNIGVSLANIQSVNLARRMEDIRAGSSGFSATGFTINTRGRDFNMGLAGPTGPEGKSGPSVMQPTPQNRWGVFVTGLGEFTDVDSTSVAPGYNFSTGGLTFGIDYRVSPNFAIGLTGGYANTNANLVNNGSLDVNGGTIGAYATGFGGGFYFDAAAFGVFNGYDSHRTALLGTASGDTDGQDFNALVAGGYDWKHGALTIGPLASFQYSYVGLDGFTEQGSLAPLSFSNQNAESTRTALGAKASYDWHVGHVVVRPEIRASWQHEFGDTDYSIVSRFANGAGNSFTVNGPAIGRDSLLIGAGAAVMFNDRVSVYAYYDGELARTNYSSNNVSAGVRVNF